MVLFRVEKVIVVTLLEATKTTMEQVGVQRMELAERGVDNSRQLVTLYGDLRRLKDYLQRCVGAFRDRVELDLAEEDLPLLTASCRRGAEMADQRLSATTDLRERGMVQSKRDLLIDWAVELASEPLFELPLESVMPSLSPAMRGLRMRLTQKFARRTLGGGTNPYEDQLQPLPSDMSGPMPPFEPAPTSDWDPPSRAPAQPNLPSSPPSRNRSHMPFAPHPAALAAATGHGAPAATAGLTHYPQPPAPVAAPAPAAPHTPPPLRSPYAPPEREPQPVVTAEAEEVVETSRLLEVSSIRDPRLRAMMALDLRALERAIGANDYRLAAVHLTSVLEGAIIDHAIPRTLDLGLSGMPDTWNPQDVLLRIFGDNCQPRDRAAAYHVFAARSLIHPALQLKSPIVVTGLAFKKHLEFVAQSLRLMGFTS